MVIVDCVTGTADATVPSALVVVVVVSDAVVMTFVAGIRKLCIVVVPVVVSDTGCDCGNGPHSFFLRAVVVNVIVIFILLLLFFDRWQ